MVMGVSFEMNLDQKVIERNRFTILDLLSDIGGFMSMITGGLSFIIASWNYKNFEYHFLTNFFKMKSTETT